MTGPAGPLFGGASSAADKRVALRAGLDSGRLQRLPGAFSPLVAKAVAEAGFEGVYVSGAALSADLGHSGNQLFDLGSVDAMFGAGFGEKISQVGDEPGIGIGGEVLRG